jgi:hypothetical protein
MESGGKMNFPMVGKLVKCKCGKLILVERGINGSDHCIGVNASCWDCLTPEQKEKAKNLYNIEI